MGLDATVMCNCFRDGKTKPPPFPYEWLEVDIDGYVNLKEAYDSDANWSTFSEWKESCCEHDGMDFASERISNWTGYRQFRAALGEIGWQHFPVLKDRLPHGNGGLCPSVASDQALDELALFSSTIEIGMKTVLVDTASGEVLHEYVAAYDGFFVFDGRCGLDAGLSQVDFVAVDRASRKEVFRATRFRQSSVESGRIVWENLDTGVVYESGIAIGLQNLAGEGGIVFPSALHVEQRRQLATDFDYIVNALRTVFDASVRTGNPVRWC